MNKLIPAYAATAVLLVGLDLLWIGVIAKPLYQQGIGHLMAETPSLTAAALFYALYPAGLLVFAVVPHAAAPQPYRAALFGAVFGFFVYATYDLTNLATLKNWPIGLSMIDVAWGSAVSAAAATAGGAAYRYLR